MAKKLSANELQQQHDRLSEGKEDGLIDVINCLEREKVNVPKYNHSIIDWGISLLKIRHLENEEIIFNMTKESDRYKNGVFVNEHQWNELDLQISKSQKKLEADGIVELQRILKETYADGKRKLIKDRVTGFKKHLKKLCKSGGANNLYAILIAEYKVKFTKFIQKVENLEDPDEKALIFAREIYRCL